MPTFLSDRCGHRSRDWYVATSWGVPARVLRLVRARWAGSGTSRTVARTREFRKSCAEQLRARLSTVASATCVLPQRAWFPTADTLSVVLTRNNTAARVTPSSVPPPTHRRPLPQRMSSTMDKIKEVRSYLRAQYWTWSTHQIANTASSIPPH